MDPADRLSMIVTLNNLGASCLKNGNISKALESLSAAFCAAKELYYDDTTTAGQTTKGTEYRLDDCMTMPLLTGATYDDEDCVYRHPITLPALTIKASRQGNHVPSIVIIFNLALTHHLLAKMPNCQNANSLFKKAERLYQYALALQQSSRQLLMVVTESSTFFIMAAINNLGLVQKDLNETEKSEKCFRQLLSILMFLTHYRKCDVSFYSFFFVRSTSHLIIQHGSNCAPAA